MRDGDLFEVADRFDEKRISYEILMGDPGVVQSTDLVVRWDDEYVFGT